MASGSLESQRGAQTKSNESESGVAPDSRDGQLERLVRVPILLVQRPCNLLVEILGRDITLLRHLDQNRVDRLPLLILLLTLDHLLRRHSSF